jgi:hypothetical protein
MYHEDHRFRLAPSLMAERRRGTAPTPGELPSQTSKPTRCFTLNQRAKTFMDQRGTLVKTTDRSGPFEEVVIQCDGRSHWNLQSRQSPSILPWLGIKNRAS